MPRGTVDSGAASPRTSVPPVARRSLMPAPNSQPSTGLVLSLPVRRTRYRGTLAHNPSPLGRLGPLTAPPSLSGGLQVAVRELVRQLVRPLAQAMGDLAQQRVA